jgi:hypothetical protein
MLTRPLALGRASLLTLGLLLACEPEAAPSGARCAPESTQGCACADGQSGAQHCTSAGVFGACECPVAAAPAVEAPAPQVAAPGAQTAAPAPEANADGGAEMAAAAPQTLTPVPGEYEVTISREGQCLTLSGSARKLPATTRKQRWRISVSSPNTLTIHDGDKPRGATLTNGSYVFDRPSEHGRALIHLNFAPDGLHGTGSASAVSHRGKNRRTAEDCSETLTITGEKA